MALNDRPPSDATRGSLGLLQMRESARLIGAQLSIDSSPGNGTRIRLRIPAWFELGLAGIEVETFTQRAGSQVTVRQSITNRTEDTVSFSGSGLSYDCDRMEYDMAKSALDQANYDADAALANGTSSGLAGMRERAVLLGGSFSVESASGRGACLNAHLPLPATVGEVCS